MASFNKYPSTQAIHFISSLIRDKTCPLLVQPARTPAARCLLIWWQLENIDLTRLQCQHQQPSSQRSHAVAFQLHVRCNSTVRSKNRVYFCVSDNLGLGLNSSFSLTTHGIRIRNIKAPEAGYMNLCFFIFFSICRQLCPNWQYTVRTGSRELAIITISIIFLLLFLSFLSYYLVCFRCLYDEIKMYIIGCTQIKDIK